MEPGAWLHPECRREFLNVGEGLLGVRRLGQSHSPRACDTKKASFANISDLSG